MNVLIACEESQAVCIEFRKRGHRAFSCDLLECSGGHPEWHIQGDVLPLLDGRCQFMTADTHTHTQADRWDMVIAFPPCTHLAVSGAAWFEKKRSDGRQREGLEFFCKFLGVDCDRVAIENPVNIVSGDYSNKWFPDIAAKYNLPLKPTQTIQPYMFGHHAKKTTCLWLKGLNPLYPTELVDPGEFYVSPQGRKFSKGSFSDCARDENGKVIAWNDPRTGRLRSKTYQGVAKAMAEQWGSPVTNQYQHDNKGQYTFW